MCIYLLLTKVHLPKRFYMLKTYKQSKSGGHRRELS